MARRNAPEINAGSMADIAFLLLIFFLVTTTIEKDRGLVRALPPEQPENVEPPIIKEKNLFVVIVNKNDELLVEDKPMEMKDLQEAAIAFLDNGGVPKGQEGYCDYCQGERDPSSSDFPDKAIVTVKNDRETSYDTYITVQNELVGAYNSLRDRESQRLYGWKFTEVKKAIDEGVYKGNEESAKEKLDVIKKMYPQKLSEIDPQS
ncbi:biopolymer transporter ExbD [Dokdonia donghaensis]|uniref:Biopolymer transporter ExbD n=1 Tax=Dokdonia donghaensis DSW-1 TaxID=1300343 RepID=A0A0A2H172_9FLAO|nr:biopolymer transporter ExbD [Dokdonia donghaensis]ANH61788.1 Biopolymer transport protein ExbD/TolR [Dokdonia donghaensis DSW-1]KGO06370.1 biopolymer transporter ExbD [Dokdonia donghaensis DSW-1]